MKFLFPIFAVLLSAGALWGNIPVVPLPRQAIVCDGEYVFAEPVIAYGEGLRNEAEYLSGKLSAAGIGNTIRPLDGRDVDIVLKVADFDNANREAYTLEVSSEGITIIGSDAAGVFYGIVTLLQLKAAGEETGTIGCVKVEDSPRYQWRGFMLDEARHFFGFEKVCQILDRMAYYKLNRFHWHLTDSEGWRIEIGAYPRLAEIGGRGCWSNPESDSVAYYTQQQIREIVAYAAARHIEVIPEVDMPGHANASNRAYPEYSGGPTEQYGEFTFNPGKEETYVFLGRVLREVVSLFPSSGLHIGGDEVAMGIESWRTNAATRALMDREGFEALRQAEKYFMDRIADTICSLGKRPAGWDEVVELDARRSTTVFWWRHNKPEALYTALVEGYETVLCPRVPCYFDFIQHPDHKWGRVWAGAYNRLDNLYAFPDALLQQMDLPDRAVEHVIGIQANAWTERIPYGKRLDFMVWPRLCALAESAWTLPERKDFDDFEQRMRFVYEDLERNGIYYYDYRDPQRHAEPAGRERGEVGRPRPVQLID